ncbi:general substrate transporter [Leucosporidium creatinivorum]|uniref:General substrate transporter n=1 Tax=Leucosporidium creatinivorum TaxID=106004 RepID=A0A1Y2F8P9_9BASI|nr:general substrate transporter [Leucosporidium creatinivorum]
MSRYFSYTLFCSLYVSIGGFLYGYDSGIITPSMVQRTFVAYFDNPTPAQKGAIVACFQVGALLGSLGVGFASDRLGRRRTIFLGSLFGILGGAIMCGAAHIAMLVIGRILLGVCVGLVTGTAPVYASEIAKVEERGRISAAQQLMIAFGFLGANWCGYGFKFLTSNAQWRGPFGIQMIPAVVLAAGIFMFPESPRWLMMVDRPQDARNALLRFHSNGSNHEFIEQEFETIRAHVAAEKLMIKPGFRSAVSTPARRHRLALGSGVWICAMLSGISFIQYFQPSIYASLNFSVDRQLLVTGLYGSMAPVFCLLSLFIVDRVNRVTMLGGGAAALSVLFSVITALSARYPAIPGQPVNATAQYFVVASVFAISCVFSATLGPLGWVVPPELFPTQLRGIGNSLVHVCHYGTSIMISQASPVGLAKIGWRYYILFICTNAASAVLFFTCYKETRGLTLEEIDKLFGDDAVEELKAEGRAVDGSIKSETMKV